MYKATYKDRETAVDILYRAFINILIPNSINFVVNKSGSREKRLKALMYYQFDMALHDGSVFISDDSKGCILYLEDRRFSFKKLWLEIQLVIHCIGIKRIPDVMAREKLIKAHHPKENFVHLWLMGVLPEAQGMGIGTALLRETMKKYAEELIYVETTTPENLEFYKKNGFNIFHETHELDYPLYFLSYV
ncbi:GNAT family N-acetyltransferase [Chryseobacterium pennipullorum]|uniref:GNAT family N-acetyltransferase n=1 Tax=Chryseobacterium pennipullorum TaxID=2258963 RepID=A0A3D9B1A5_9FLAO|nr:GNAT family N-acetyltransferase [Chryseobacterium pennipullorum]REC47046.1 GNAT family N-acetyltransferase [Chryseobacterium pennipullorum]